MKYAHRQRSFHTVPGICFWFLLVSINSKFFFKSRSLYKCSPLDRFLIFPATVFDPILIESGFHHEILIYWIWLDPDFWCWCHWFISSFLLYLLNRIFASQSDPGSNRSLVHALVLDNILHPSLDRSRLASSLSWYWFYIRDLSVFAPIGHQIFAPVLWFPATFYGDHAIFTYWI